MTNGTFISQLDCTARRSNAQSTVYRNGVIYNGDGTNKINILGQNASSYIDDAVDPNTAYNMHASNIINALSSSTLGLLSLDINGLTNHKFFSNGNVTFGAASNNAKAIVDISSNSYKSRCF